MNKVFAEFKYLFLRGRFIFYIIILEKIVFFVLFLLLARSYTHNEFGGITVIFAFSNILATAFDFGLPNFFQREFAILSASRLKDFNSAITIRIYFYFLYIAIVLLYCLSNPLVTLDVAFIIASAIYIFSTSNLFRTALYGLNLFREVFQPRLISMSVFFIAGICSVIIHNLFLFSIALLVASVGELYFLILPFNKNNYRISLAAIVPLKKIMSIAKSSLPFGLSLLFVMIYDRVDILMIEKFLNLESVAFYSVAYSLYKLPQQLFIFLFMPLFTDLSSEYNSESGINFNKVIKVGSFILVFTSACAIGYQLFSEYLIKIFYGGSYLNSAAILRILSFTIPFIILNNLTGITLNSIRKERMTVLTVLVGAIINVSMNLVFIPSYGIYGAAIVTLITEASILLIQFVMILLIRNRLGLLQHFKREIA